MVQKVKVLFTLNVSPLSVGAHKPRNKGDVCVGAFTKHFTSSVHHFSM